MTVAGQNGERLQYEGGPVQHEPQLYLLWWGQNWEKGSSNIELAGALKRFYLNLQAENELPKSTAAWQKIMTQYYDNAGPGPKKAHIVAQKDEYNVAAPQSVTRGMMEEQVQKLIEGGAQANANTQFVLLAAPGTTFANPNEVQCGYHTDTEAGYGEHHEHYTFSIIPDAKNVGCVESQVTGTEEAKVIGSTTETASHEFAESATDPLTTRYYGAGEQDPYTSNLGWRANEEGEEEGPEIADICNNLGPFKLANSSWVTKLWDDQGGNKCSLEDPPYEQPPAPSVTTEAATGITETAATLHASVNPSGPDTHYYFQYGPTTSYGSTTPEGNAGYGTTNVPESPTISGLESGMTYHYRVVATSWAGTSYGSDESFTTHAAPSMTVAGGKIEAITGDMSGAVYRTTSDFVQNTWQTASLGGLSGVVESATTSVTDSGGDVWSAFEGPGHTLWVGVDLAKGGWTLSYESPTEGTTYSSPSAVIDSNKNVWVAAEGPNHTLNLAEYSGSKWTISTPVTASDVYSAPSVVADSSGDLWVSFEGPGNTLWVAVRYANGTWTTSYESPTEGTTYSSPSTVIDSNKNVWVAAEGPNHTLNLAEYSGSKWTTSTQVTAADVYSAPSAAVDSGGDVWVSWEGPGNQLWVGVHLGSGTWTMSYEGPNNTIYSAPSAVVDSEGNVWVGAQGANDDALVVIGRIASTDAWSGSYSGEPDKASNTSAPAMVVADGGIAAATEGAGNALFMTTSDFAQSTWQSALISASWGTSSPSAVTDSGGDVWVASQGPNNSLWIGVDFPDGGWSPSYEGPTGTTYSTPAMAIDSNKNVWVAAEGPNHTLNLTEWSAGSGWTVSTPVTGSDVYSTPAIVGDSGGDLWIAWEGPGNQLWIGVRNSKGEWGMSYEGPSSMVYSAPSIVLNSSNVWVVFEGPSNTLDFTEWSSASGWVTSTAITAADVYSAPSAAIVSGGYVWVAFEGPSNQLWDGARPSSGGWDASYEGPSRTIYSAPSEVIDSEGNIWVGAQGANNTLNVTVRRTSTGVWEGSYQGG